MPSRRHILRVAGAALVGTAGCAGDAADTPRATDAPTTDRPPQTPTQTASEPTPDESAFDDDVPAWTPEWTEAFGDWGVLGLTTAHDRLYAVLQSALASGTSAVAAVEPADGTVAWEDGDNGQWLLTDPSGETLFTRAGSALDQATSYAADGTTRWTFNPPSTNAWPAAATNDALAVTGITADEGSFKTVYSVDEEGKARKSLDRDTVFDAAGFDGRIYLADGRSELLALEP